MYVTLDEGGKGRTFVQMQVTPGSLSLYLSSSLSQKESVSLAVCVCETHHVEPRPWPWFHSKGYSGRHAKKANEKNI